MTCEEIARFIGTSRGAVLNRLYHARRQLKKEMIPMMEKTLGTFQLPPTFTQRMMNRIDRTLPTTTPQGKPILPWIAATASLVFALIIGLGQQAMTWFQQPYSLNAVEPASLIELIDAPMISIPETKPDLANRRGQLNAPEDKKGIGPNGTSFSAADSDEAVKGHNDSKWTQTNGPYGGRTNTLYRASDGSLYALTDMQVFRSSNHGDTWVQVYNSLTANPADSWLSGTITDANGVLYINTAATILYSDNRGDSWQQINYLYGADKEIRTFSVIGSRIYISRVKDGIVYSDDYGESWNAIQDGLPAKPPDKFATVGKTLFAKVDNVIFRLREGETSWTKITNLPNLRFLIAEKKALIIGSQTDLRRSLDEGESWTSMTHSTTVQVHNMISGKKIVKERDIRSLITTGRDVLQLESPLEPTRITEERENWGPMTRGLKNQSLIIENVAAFGDTRYVLLNDGTLLRSTDIGLLGSTEASSLSRYFMSTDGMAAPSERGICKMENYVRWNTMVATGLDTRFVSADSIAALSEHVVSICNAAGIFRLTDGAEAWRQTNDGIVGSMVQSLVSFKDALYASTHNRNGVFKSADGGDRWTPIHGGLPTTDVGALVTSGEALYLGVNEDYLTGAEDRTYTAGIYRWADDRNSWMPVQTEMRTDYRLKGYNQMYSVELLSNSEDTFYAIAQVGRGSRLFRWRSGNRYWTDISPHPEDWIYGGDDELTGLAVANETIYIAADMDLYRSRNSGDTWSKIEFRASPSSRYLPQITGVVVLGKAVFASTRESGVFRSRDGGKNWDSVNGGLPQGYSSELHAIGNTLYATDSDQGIYRFKDGQDTWEFVKPSVSDMLSGALTIAEGILYAGMGESGVYRIALNNADRD